MSAALLVILAAVINVVGAVVNIVVMRKMREISEGVAKLLPCSDKLERRAK